MTTFTLIALTLINTAAGAFLAYQLLDLAAAVVGMARRR